MLKIIFIRGIILLPLKILVVISEYATPILVNQLTQVYESRQQIVPFSYQYFTEWLINLYGLLILAQIGEYYVTRFYQRQELLLKQITNRYLSRSLFQKSIRLYANMSQEGNTSFHGMLKELRQIENATESFYTLVRVFFELSVGGFYLGYILKDQDAIFSSLKWGVLLSLLALVGASAAQIFAWRIQHFSDQRLKLTQDIINGIKNIKYLQWEQIFIDKMLSVRAKEFFGTTGVQYVDTVINFFRRMSSIVLLFATFYSLKELPSTQFYTILIFFDKFVYPLNTFPWCLGEFLGSLISIYKINTYFKQPEILDEQRITEQIKFPSTVNGLSIFDKSVAFLSGKQQVNNGNQQVFQLKGKIDIKPGLTYMVIGKVGSGKTAFLDSLIGEMFGGIAQVAGRKAYVSQNPWVFEGTVRENILFGDIFSSEFYHKCIHSSALDEDLQNFDEGDHKNVGRDGTNLSGGQRQRLAICRALYQNADVYIFDDILSSVDEHVADLIVQRTINEQLKGKTIIMSISQHQYLRYADIIINIDQDIKQINRESNEFKQLVGDQEITLTHHSEFRHDWNIQAKPQKISGKADQQVDTDFDGKNEIIINLKFYLKILGLPTIMLFLISTIAQQSFKGLFELWTHSYIFSIVQGTQPFLIQNNFQLTFIYFFIIVAALTLIRGFAYSFATLQSAQRVFKVVISKFLILKVFVFDNNGPRFFIRRLFNDMEQLDDLPLNYFFSVVFDTIALVIIIASQQMMIVPFTAISFYMITNHYKRYMILNESRERQFNQKQNQIKDMNTFISETQKGLKVIRSSEKLKQFSHQFDEILEQKYAQSNLDLELSHFANKDNTIIQNGAFLLFVLTQIVIQGKTDIFDSLNHSLALTYASMLFGQHSISKCIFSWKRVITVCSSIQRLRGLAQSQTEGKFLRVECQSMRADASSFIQFENVSLNYQAAKGLKETGLYALRNINLSIQKGQKVAFCGRTGSGKSSILNILVKLYDLTHGTIRINGMDIQDLSCKQLRSRMSVIPQMGFLFSGTLLQNLNPKGNLSEKQIVQFLRDHNLLQNRLKDIVDSGQLSSFHIEPSGENLSNGEKQIINFAQQVLELKDIVCMDEATSNMDPHTNDIVMESLFKFLGGRTLLLISHRLSNLQNFDKIFVMKDGEIVGEGTYSELLDGNQYFQELKSQLT